jgi:uncharacterized repeat protein (TIGR01451 family)
MIHLSAAIPARSARRAQTSDVAARRANAWVNLKDEVDVPTGYVGAAGLKQVMEQNLSVPVSLASGDFDEDGVPDLISGHVGPGGGILTLQRGNIETHWPHRPLQQATDNRQLTTDTTPFLPEARVFGVPEAPDFLGAGDFDSDGHWDVVAAARGSDALYVLPGDGRGRLRRAERLKLPGIVTALATGEINRADGLTDVVVGIVGANGPEVLVFESPDGALRGEPEAIPLPAAATALALGQLDEGYEMDLAAAAGSELVIVHGRDRSIADCGLQIADCGLKAAAVDRLSLPFAIASLALGEFNRDEEQRTEIALLGDDQAVHILGIRNSGLGVRDQSPRPLAQKENWEITDVLPLPQPPNPESRTPIPQLIRAKVSSLPTDDLIVLDHSNRRLRVITTDHKQRTTNNGPLTSVSLDVADIPVAVLPMRLNEDALSDLVILKSGAEAPVTVAMTQPARTFVVNLTTGGSDANRSDNRCDTDLNAPGDQCTFPAAIDQANSSPGEDAIRFSVTSAVSGSSLNDPVVIDGGASRVEITGSRSIFVSAGRSTVRGLVVNRIGISNNGGNFIEGNFVGTDVTGKVAATPNASSDGVVIENAPDNTIGGTTAAARNLISGNFYGVAFNGVRTTGNKVQGNYIGTDVTGTAALGNVEGVHDTTSTGGNPSNNIIGGTTAGAGNVISGNRRYGVGVFGNGNMVQGNFIGTNANGAQALGNGGTFGDAGVFIRAANTTVGGTSIGARNVISGNGPNAGVLIDGTTSTMNLVQGNFIGTDATGVLALSNRYGVRVLAPNNTIGGTVSGARNIISGNTESGVEISGSGATGNQVQGNYIGTKPVGTEALGNRDGVRISAAANTLIGGATSAAGNVISGNRENGVLISANGTRVQGNFIGTQSGGASALGNMLDGVNVSGNNNTIGGTGSGEGNTIAFNGRAGVAVLSGTGNGIRRNSMFSNVYMGIDLGNNGTSLNDPKDGDTGPNNYQNFPSLTPRMDGSKQWLLTSTPNTTFTVEFFSNTACHSTGQGEGTTFMSSTTATTDASGDATVSGPSSSLVTATATDPNNNTSEFSHCGEPDLVVNMASDEDDAHRGGGVCDVDLKTPGNQCTLRAALTESNGHPSKQTITFNIPGGGVPTIRGQSVLGLPVVTDPVVIDATTQPGGKVELDGSNAGSSSALVITAGNSTVKGFVINRFGTSSDCGYGIFLADKGGNVIQGNLIGTDVAGTTRLRNTCAAVAVTSPNNLIGGTKPEERNVLSGSAYGVYITGTNASGNRVEGNFIGVDATGTQAVINGFGGIYIEGASNNTIGGTASGARNIISGNFGRAGIHIRGTGNDPAKGNKVQGNFIGTDVTGTKALGNNIHGIQIDDTSLDSANNTTGNLVGGTTVEARNIISGNGAGGSTGVGVFIASGAGANLVQGNYIGTDVTGAVALGNRSGGVLISSAPKSQLGGTAAGAGNLISGNGGAGVSVSGSDGTLVQGNLIGTDAAGAKALENGSDGVTISVGSNITIGGTVAAARNVISGNKGSGVRISGISTINATGNLVQGNFIGTDVTGTKPVGNGGGTFSLSGNGVVLSEAAGNTIGGATAGAGNVIAFNLGTGVLITGPDASMNKNKDRVSQNSIFSNSRLGIDLSRRSFDFDGVTPNDPMDADVGPNDLQNFPELTIDADGSTIKGTLDSKPGAQFTIEFFSNTDCDSSGNGEGEKFLGSMMATTDGNGRASFTSPVPAPTGELITATATDADGNTSEFSKCTSTGGGPGPVKPAITISGQKFEDKNGNGRKETGDDGLAGWTIQLDLDNDGKVDGTTKTDARGNYRFPAVAPGSNVNISAIGATSSGTPNIRQDSEPETTITIDPSNPSRLFAASNKGEKLFGAYSADGGITWTARIMADGSDGIPQACCDPKATFDAFGNLFLTYMNTSRASERKAVIVLSTDGGKTFRPLAEFPASDQPMIAVGPGDAAGTGSLWIVAQNFTSAIEARAARVRPGGMVECAVSPSQCDGVFSRPQIVQEMRDVNFARLAIGPTGQVLVAFQEPASPGTGPATIFVNLDADGLGPQPFSATNAKCVVEKGQPSTQCVTTNIGSETLLAQPNRGIDVEANLAWDRARGPHGRVYLVYTDEDASHTTVPNKTSMDIIVRFSDDSGASWSGPVRVNDTRTNSRFLPTISVDPKSSVVAVAWLDARNDTTGGGPGGKNNDDAQLFTAISTDGGRTFLPNAQVSAGTSSAAAACVSVDYGDYMGSAFYNGVFYPAWADNSNSTGDNPPIPGLTCPTNNLPVTAFDIYTAAVKVIGPGTHKLSEMPQQGWTQTFPVMPGTHTLQAQSGSSLTDRDFGNFKNMRACGAKFDDKNGNGKRDAGEPGLSGWTIYVDANRSGKLDTGEKSAITNQQGDYCIENIGPGDPSGPRTFIVREELRPQWTQLVPAPPNDFYENPIQSGLEVRNADFGNVPAPATVKVENATKVCTPTDAYPRIAAQPAAGPNFPAIPEQPPTQIKCTFEAEVVLDGISGNIGPVSLTIFDGFSPGLFFDRLTASNPPLKVSSYTNNVLSFDPILLELPPQTVLQRFRISFEYTAFLNDLAEQRDPQQNCITLRFTDPRTGRQVFERGGFCADTDVLVPRLSVVKYASSTTGLPGDRKTFTVVVYNSGNIFLQNVNVDALIPNNMTLVQDSVNPPPTAGAGNTIRWRGLGPIDAGGSLAVSYAATINANTPEGTQMVDQAFANATAPNFAGSGERQLNATSNQITVVVSPIRVGIDLTLAATPTQACLPTVVNYTIKVTNSGQITLNRVQLSLTQATLPVDGNPSFPMVIDSLSPGESRTVTYKGQIGPRQKGFLVDVASVVGTPVNRDVQVAPPVAAVTTTAVRVLPPVITKITPASGAQGSNDLELKIEGACFVPGTVVSFMPSGGIEIIPPTPPDFGFVNTTELRQRINIKSDAPLGEREVFVTNPSGLSGGERPFNLFTVALPNNDLCSQATAITTTPFTQTRDTRAATTSPDDPLQSCSSAGPARNSNSVWYRFTPSQNGTVTVSTVGSNYDTILTAFTGACGSLREAACNDDFGSGIDSQITFEVTAGTAYLIEVTDFDDRPGGGMLVFTLRFTPR